MKNILYGSLIQYSSLLNNRSTIVNTTFRKYFQQSVLTPNTAMALNLKICEEPPLIGDSQQHRLQMLSRGGTVKMFFTTQSWDNRTIKNRNTISCPVEYHRATALWEPVAAKQERWSANRMEVAYRKIHMRMCVAVCVRQVTMDRVPLD